VGAGDDVDYEFRGGPHDLPLRLRAVGLSPHDYSDAPASYGAAAHPLGIDAPFIGTAWDSEGASQHDADALGDDDHGIDDEDSVTFHAPLRASSTFNVEPDLSGSSHIRVATFGGSGGAWLDAWIDFDQSGTFDAIEHVGGGLSFPIPAGSSSVGLYITLPAGAALGSTFARFRVSHTGGVGPTGLSAAGEVEDHRVEIFPYDDFGDAPASYGTLLADDGARHLGRGPELGRSDSEPGPYLDFEADAFPSLHANADDLFGLDDETGVVFAPIYSTPNATLSNHVNVYAALAVAGDGWEMAHLDAWIDFDASGSFDADEHFDAPITQPGLTQVPFTVPAGAVVGDAYARFRISRFGGLGPTGPAATGEVEDYQVTIQPLVGVRPANVLTINAQGLERVLVTDLGNGEVNVELPVLALQQRFSGIELANIVAGDARLEFEFAGHPEATKLKWLHDALSVIADYGDAPPQWVFPAQSSEPTSYGDARHRGGGPILGSKWDSELHSQQAGDADWWGAIHALGDDQFGIDDEDAFDPLDLDVRTSPSHDVDHTLTLDVPAIDVGPGIDGWLDAWIDFNHNGAFDPAEHLGHGASIPIDPIVDADGKAVIHYSVPAGTTPGITFARFRISSTGGLGPTGEAPDGEVEDHWIFIKGLAVAHNLENQTVTVRAVDIDHLEITDLGDGVAVVSVPSAGFEQSYFNVGRIEYDLVAPTDQIGYEYAGSPVQRMIPVNPLGRERHDFSDSPVSYGIARHTVRGPFLGFHWDTEPVPQPHASALGDDLAHDDEDGLLTFGLPGSAGREMSGTLKLQIPRVIGPQIPFLTGWIDFDHSGTFDSDERIAGLQVGSPLSATTVDLPVTIPAGVLGGPIFARFRISSRGSADPTEPADDGEVEDHLITIRLEAPQRAMFDANSHRLTVNGTAQDDFLNITANDSGRLQIFVAAGSEIPIFDATTGQPLDPAGDQWPTGANTRSIFVDTLGGDDHVSALDTHGLLAGIDWTIKTGDGADDVSASLVAAAAGSFTAITGTGDDRIAAKMGIGPVPFLPSGQMIFNLDSGAGNDHVTTELIPPPDSSLSSNGSLPAALTAHWNVALGSGNDFFSGVIIPPPDPAITYGLLMLSWNVVAGAGNDVLSFDGNALRAGNSQIDVQMDGGAGNDHITAKMGIGPTPFLPSMHSNISLNGGAGNDTISAQGIINPGVLVGFNPQPEPPLVQLNFDLNGGAGNDSISAQGIVHPGVLVGFNPQPEPPIVHLNFDLRGDAGNDRLDATIGGQPIPDDNEPPPDDNVPSMISITMDGGTGNDTLDTTIDGEPVPGDDIPPPDDNVTSMVAITMDGGAGNDTIAAHYVGGVDRSQIGRRVHILARGGSGNDSLRADISPRAADLIFMDFDGGQGNDLIRIDLRDASNASAQKVHVHVRGGDGNDNLFLLVATARPKSLLDLLLDGGQGRDRATATSNVKLKNCENVLQPPSP